MTEWEFQIFTRGIIVGAVSMLILALIAAWILHVL